jgi:hypothetical protein
LVEALAPLYFEPTFDPERAIPPGNGMMTPATWRIALTAASVAASVFAALRPMTMILPPPTACLVR